MKILHASDFHLDSPFGNLDAARAMTRRRELRELPARLAALARERDVDLVLLPGDIFDGQRVYPETLRALGEALGAAGCPVVIAPGNHDCIRPGSPYVEGQWPDNVHIFTGRDMAAFSFPELGCTVHGCAFTGPHREDDPLAGFAAPGDGQLHLLCLHGEVAPAGDYGPIAPFSLSRSGAAYAALGHIHARTELQWEGDTSWAYCGCPEGRGFDECGTKGALLVTVGEGGVSAEFCPLCARRYRVERVDAAEFAAVLPEESPDLVRYILTGESETAPDLAGLVRLAESRCFYAEVRDETTLPRRLWDRISEDSLTGLFLREMARRLDLASAEERPGLLLAARFGLAALEGGEDICP